MLLRQLRRRFGDLPDAVVTRVTTADSHALGVWGERVITARTLDEVWRGR